MAAAIDKLQYVSEQSVANFIVVQFSSNLSGESKRGSGT